MRTTVHLTTGAPAPPLAAASAIRVREGVPADGGPRGGRWAESGQSAGGLAARGGAGDGNL